MNLSVAGVSTLIGAGVGFVKFSEINHISCILKFFKSYGKGIPFHWRFLGFTPRKILNNPFPADGAISKAKHPPTSPLTQQTGHVLYHPFNLCIGGVILV